MIVSHKSSTGIDITTVNNKAPHIFVTYCNRDTICTRVVDKNNEQITYNHQNMDPALYDWRLVNISRMSRGEGICEYYFVTRCTCLTFISKHVAIVYVKQPAAVQLSPCTIGRRYYVLPSPRYIGMIMSKLPRTPIVLCRRKQLTK